MDKSDFSWCLFLPATARALLNYRTKQKTLLNALYESIPEETHYLHDPDGQPLSEIDPFTFLGVLNRHISQEKKLEVAGFYRSFFKLTEAVPENYHGIPPLSNQNSMFFSFKNGKTHEEIENLWNVCQYTLTGDSRLGALYDDMVQNQYGIKFNITCGMYWICPDQFFPLDAPSRNFLREHGIECEDTKAPSFSEYTTICEKAKALLPKLTGKPSTFAEVTRAIFSSLHH